MEPVNSITRYHAENDTLGEDRLKKLGLEDQATALRAELDRVISDQFTPEVLPYSHKEWRPSLLSLKAVILCGDARKDRHNIFESLLSDYFQMHTARFPGLEVGRFRTSSRSSTNFVLVSQLHASYKGDFC